MSAPVVIVGSGLAGYTVAREFRRIDRQTPLVLISRDHAGFYSKPMLSNALASGKTALSLVMKPVQKMAEELAADIRSHTGVRQLDTATQTLTLDSGETIVYRDLVLALGADPVAHGLQGSAADQVLSVNDLDDYARFSERLAELKRVVILGAGLIGCEFANDLLSRGVTPIVVDPAQGPLSRLLPPKSSAWLRDKLQAAGVQFEWGTTATAVDRLQDTTELSVTLSDGRHLVAGLVLSAIGLRPRVALAQAAGIAVQRGIVTDAHLQTSAPHVYAVGDCAEVMGHSLPYVMPLMNQGRALAATLGGTPTAVVYPAMAVTVKTPACPTVVCPPAQTTGGEWQETLGEQGVEARCLHADGSLLGFALLGAATGQKQALSGLVKPWLT